MKKVNVLIITGFALFLMAGIANAADLDDLDVTIRMMESNDDVNEMENELHLPDSAREHAEDHHDAHDNDGHDDHSADREDHEDDREGFEDDREANEESHDSHEEGVEDSDGGSDEHPETE